MPNILSLKYIFFWKKEIINAAYSLTVWKFGDFSITQILREISFGDSRSAKSAISTHLEALNVDFYEFQHFLKAHIHQINLIHWL